MAGLSSVAFRALSSFARDIKIAHSVFALPFAVSAIWIGKTGWPSVSQAALLIVCMVSARSFAMGVNRFLDRRIDAENPRTSNREIPSGRLAASSSLAISLGFGVVMVAGAFALNPLAGWLSFPTLAGLACYSLLKRFTSLTHWYLGLCLGAAPCAVSVALNGQLTSPVVWLGLGVSLWTAGFDLLYSLQDMRFDRSVGLRSVPASFGPRATLWLSRICYALAVYSWHLAGWLAYQTTIYYGALGVIALILIYQHWIIRDAANDGESRRLNQAFFTANAWVSVLYLAAVVLDWWFSVPLA